MALLGGSEDAHAHASVVAETVAASVSVDVDDDATGRCEDADEKRAGAGVRHVYEHEDVIVVVAVVVGAVDEGENESESASETAVRDETMKGGRTGVEEDATEMKSAVEVVAHESEKAEVDRAGDAGEDWEGDREDACHGVAKILH